MNTLAFVDTETTGLDADLHEIWEVGLILRDAAGIDTEHEWQLLGDLGRADPMALKIGRFHERRGENTDIGDPSTFADDFAAITVGAHLVGAVVSFDEERLRRLLRAQGQCPMWHYHVVDVEALAAGMLAARGIDMGFTDDQDRKEDAAFLLALAAPPWNSEELSRAVGVEPSDFDRHTALGDARWARAIYDAVCVG